MKVLVLLVFACLSANAQVFGGGNATKLRGKPIGNLSGCADGNALVYTASTNTWGCGAGGGGTADPGANGLVARTGSGTSAARTITAASGVTVTNGSGVSGNPTIGVDFAVVPGLAASNAFSNLNDFSAGSVKLPAVAFSGQTDGATITWAIASALDANASVTLGGNRTLNITNPVIGGNYVFKITQDGTGSRTLTLGTGCTWKVISGGSGAITLSTAASSVDVLAFTYDGTNCLATLGKNYN